MANEPHVRRHPHAAAIMRSVEIGFLELPQSRLLRENLRMKKRFVLLPLLVLALGLAVSRCSNADEPEAKTSKRATAARFGRSIVRYCQKCHSGERTEAEIDLGAFATWADVRKHPETWQKVRRDARQRPDAAQGSPPADRRRTDASCSSGSAAISRSRRGPARAIRAGSCCAGSATPNTPTRSAT